MDFIPFFIEMSPRLECLLKFIFMSFNENMLFVRNIILYELLFLHHEYMNHLIIIDSLN